MTRTSTANRLRRIDSVKFESIYSEKDAIRYDELRIGNMSFEDIEPFLHKLPPREIDLVTLYRKYGKNQKDIAKMFSVTQGAVSSRLRRAADRLQFLRDLPKITDAEIESHLSKIFDDPIEIEIIKCMKDTTCQSRTAVLINEKFHLTGEKERMTQVKVRHRFEKCLALLGSLKDTDPKYLRFYTLLSFIKKNLYKLHEVKLPHFDRGKYAVFSLKT
jgi:predicted transcriptional regulator